MAATQPKSTPPPLNLQPNSAPTMTPHPAPLTIGIVAAEISGDTLGAQLIADLRTYLPHCHIIGVGGDKMAAQGLQSLIDMERLSVMGLIEVVRHLPALFAARRTILDAFCAHKIDIFIGIDAPDFNLRLGKRLKPRGVFCVQYVSPSIWAWRENRIHAIKDATDLVLCLFEFELTVYKKHRHSAVFVGQPLIDNLSPCAPIGAQPSSDYPARNPHQICLMPGSRNSEIAAILPTLLHTFAQLHAQKPNLTAVLPLASAAQMATVLAIIERETPQLHHLFTIYTPTDKTAHAALQQSALTLIASGTATLEALLLHTPMVVVYKTSPLTFAIARRLVKTPFIALPNILSHHYTGAPIVPELLQDNATPANIAAAAWHILDNLDDSSSQTVAKYFPDNTIDGLKNFAQSLKNQPKTNPAAAIIAAYCAR